MAEQNSIMMSAVNLTKKYEDGVLALNDLNFNVSEGELFCLLGANGAGKSTTINIFLNFIEATSGKAYINGIDVSTDPLRAKKYASYVSENVLLYKNYNAVQNLSFFGNLAGVKDISREMIRDVLLKVGLDENSHRKKTKSFSKGMRQKLGIAIAIIKNAPVIFLDEPTSGLDPKAASELMNLLLSLRSEGKAIFMSTHDIFRASSYADRIGIMKDGQLVFMKDSRELQNTDLEGLYINYMKD